MRLIKILSFIVCIIVINNIIILTPFTSVFLYYGIFILIFFISLFRSKSKIDFLTFLFLLICFLSIQFNNIEIFIRPLERYLVFLSLLLVLSAFIDNKFLNILKLFLLKNINRMIILTVLSSFLLKITGLYNGLDFANHFGGITLSSMSIAPLAGLSFIICVFYLIIYF